MAGNTTSLSTYVNLFTKRSQGFGDSPNGINWLQFDVTISESHVATSQVTTNPVQNGAQIASNIINDPMRITVEGVVTDTPLLGTIANTAATGITGVASDAKTSKSRGQAAFDHLVEVKNNKELVTLDTGLARYKNMAITSVSTTTTEKTYYAPIITLVFDEVIMNSTENGKGTQSMGTLVTEAPSISQGVSILAALAALVRAIK